jgi:hypothetical protein
LLASRSTLRYARQVRRPCPEAAASRWQVASAPDKPPRLPVTLVALVVKKLIVAFEGRVGSEESLQATLIALNTAATISC